LDVGGHGRFTTAGDDLVVLAAVGFGQQVDVVAGLKKGQRKLEKSLKDQEKIYFLKSDIDLKHMALYRRPF
ncbi:hypothetical protein, partial [Pseudomonas syringae]|uniref:hypothetical protein n=1 Tax=Pseudomonas syringae TaxID=317 RepID=UPI001414CE45